MIPIRLSSLYPGTGSAPLRSLNGLVMSFIDCSYSKSKKVLPIWKLIPIVQLTINFSADSVN